VFRLALYIPHRSCFAYELCLSLIAWRWYLQVLTRASSYQLTYYICIHWSSLFYRCFIQFNITKSWFRFNLAEICYLKICYTYNIAIMKIVHKTFFVDNFKYFCSTIFFLNSIFFKILRKKTEKNHVFLRFFQNGGKIWPTAIFS